MSWFAFNRLITSRRISLNSVRSWCVYLLRLRWFACVLVCLCSHSCWDLVFFSLPFLLLLFHFLMILPRYCWAVVNGWYRLFLYILHVCCCCVFFSLLFFFIALVNNTIFSYILYHSYQSSILVLGFTLTQSNR